MTTPSQSSKDQTEFLSDVLASELLSDAQFVQAVGAMPPDATTAAAAAQFLVAAGFLTQFQAQRLLAGRCEGFILGQYAILEQIGRGSVGRVYKARHRTMNRDVAIKMLAPDVTRTDTARQSFLREVRAAARLNHPNIVTAYDTNEVGERSYLVMEYVDGPTLDALVRTRGPLPVAEACELIRQTAVGLQHAHEQGMVHRDIKPQNVLVAPASSTHPGCIVKIADFGIARLTPGVGEPGSVRNRVVTDRGSPRLLGTPDYVAPEQAHNPRVADHRADLYSLGCTFYFLLTGQPPFPGGTLQEKLLRHQFEAPVPVERLRADVPPAIVEIIARLLSKDPNSRYQSAAAVAARLDGLAAGAVAGHDDGAVVSFELPPVQAGQYSFTSGALTGAHATTTDTSPWSQLTDESAGDEVTLGPEDRIATVAAPTTGRRLVRRRPLMSQSRGLTPLSIIGFVGCVVMVLGLLLRVLAK